MRIQIGSGPKPLEGFTNVEPRPIGAGSRKGHAADLGFACDGSVDVIFNNAVFEHLYVGQQVSALREWRRVLADDGVVVCIGIPDFETIARLYLAAVSDPGAPEFDLSDVYRFTHGDPEQGTLVNWQRWRPDRHLDRAPKEWLPQLHKALFDAPNLARLFELAGFDATIIRYRFPTDDHDLTIGAVAGRQPQPVGTSLARVPGVERFVDLATVEVVRVPEGSSAMARQAAAEDRGRYGSVERAARQVRRTYRSTRAVLARTLTGAP